MNILKLAIVVGLAGLAYNQWYKPTERGPRGADQVASLTGNGFLIMPPAAEGYRREVVIVAPDNCPADGAQRAEALAGRLREHGIPIARSSAFNFNFTDAPPGAVDRILDVGRGDVPIVFVGGKVKANPTLEEVLAEFAATRL